MKKIFLSPLFLFLLACHSPSAETETLAAKASVKTADSLSMWTRNIVTYPTFSTPENAVNYTDPNGMKQGKWVTIVAGKIVFTVEYKDGKTVEGC
jgi:hypothetical protein